MSVYFKTCTGGGMVYALVSEASLETGMSSNLIQCTNALVAQMDRA